MKNKLILVWSILIISNYAFAKTALDLLKENHCGVRYVAPIQTSNSQLSDLINAGFAVDNFFPTTLHVKSTEGYRAKLDLEKNRILTISLFSYVNDKPVVPDEGPLNVDLSINRDPDIHSIDNSIINPLNMWSTIRSVNLKISTLSNFSIRLDTENRTFVANLPSRYLYFTCH